MKYVRCPATKRVGGLIADSPHEVQCEWDDHERGQHHAIYRVYPGADPTHVWWD